MAKQIITFVVCIPVNLFGWLLFGVLHLCGAVKTQKTLKKFLWVVHGVPGGFLERHWHYSTTLGPHCIYLHPKASGKTLLHEMRHTVQAEGISIAWGLTALCSWNLVMVCMWPAAWFVFYLGASVAAWLRGEPWYRGNEYEVAAYEQPYQNDTDKEI